MNTDLLKKFAANVKRQKEIKEALPALIPLEYQELETTLKKLKTEEAELRPEIVKHLKTEEVDKYSSAGFGTFSVLPNRSWQYSEKYERMKAGTEKTIKELNDRLAALREEEEKDGCAKQIEGEPTLRYLPTKS